MRAALDLAKARERQRRGEFAVEGAREIDRALAAGVRPIAAFWRPDGQRSPAADAIVAGLSAVGGVEGHEVTAAVFERLVVRGDSDGVLVVFARPEPPRLDQLRLPSDPLIVAVAGVEKPGNLGAILRVCDGAGVDAVVLLDGTVEVTNPNVIRSSLGTVFTSLVLTAESEPFARWCRDHAVRTCATALADRALEYTRAPLAGAVALLVGSEAWGLPRWWLEHADELLRIPMRGVADSLNVATATAVVVYEALRQRGGR